MEKHYDLVYQQGIANVFRVTIPSPGTAQTPRYERVRQATFRDCEQFCAGLIEAGMDVSIWHSDVAGDVLLCNAGAAWQEGAGDLWRSQKHPPRSANYASL